MKYSQNWLVPALALAGVAIAGMALQHGRGEAEIVMAPAAVASDGAAPSAGIDASRVKAMAAKLPLGFEPNRGQARPGIDYVSRGRGYTLSLGPGQAELELTTSVKRPDSPRPTRPDQLEAKGVPDAPVASRRVRIALKGANLDAKGSAIGEQPGKTNYLLGGDPSKWRKDVPSFAKVQYEAVYPNVDLVYYGTQGQLEYDFVVRPGGDPEGVALSISGADGVRLDQAGDLVLAVDGAEVRQGRPVAYQEIAGVRQKVAASFEMRPDHTVGFEIGEYDRSLPLVVDPYVSYASYLGKNGTDDPWVMAVDSTGIYVAGATGTAWFTSANTTTDYASYDTTYASSYDIFLTKLSLDGQRIIYSTFYGGLYDDRCRGIAVDASQNVYFTGQTNGSAGHFPAVNNWQTNIGGGYDAYLVKLGPTGNTVAFSSWLGGSLNDAAFGVALDSSGNAYVTGYTASTNMFPSSITTGVAQPTKNADLDMYVVKIAAAGGVSGRLLATYLGGSKAEVGNGIAVDAAGYVYAIGDSQSNAVSGGIPFPTTAGAYQTVSKGSTDAVIVKLNSDFTFSTSGGRTPFSTYFGGTQVESVSSLRLDTIGNIYIAGTTNSSAVGVGQQPLPTMNAYQSTALGVGDAFLSKFDNFSALLYSTYFGSANNQDYALALAVDDTGKAWIAGYTKSTSGFPTLNALTGQTSYRGGNSDGFISRFDTTLAGASSLLSSSYYGGNAADEIRALSPLNPSCETVYVYGITTSSTLLPVVNPYQAAKATALSDADTFLAKIDETPPPVAYAGPDAEVCPGTNASLSGSVTSGGTAPFTYEWREGGVLIATGQNPSVSLSNGSHTIVLRVIDACYSVSHDTVVVNAADTTAPVIDTYPSNQTLPNTLGECYVQVNPGTITATDACSTATYSATANPGSQTITPNAVNQFDIDPPADSDGVAGQTTYTITWRATDATGNFSTVQTTLTVYDAEAPVFNVGVPTVATAIATGDSAGVFIDYPDEGTQVTDNCDVMFIEGFRDNPGSPDVSITADGIYDFPVGRTLITWLAVDASINFEVYFTEVLVDGKSEFSVDNEDWTIEGTATGPTHENMGGNPDGYIHGDDTLGAGSPWYFVAPAKYYSTILNPYATAITFDLRQNAGTALDDTEDVILEGAGVTLTYDLAQPGTSWTSYNVPLNSASGWTNKTTGMPATLSDLTSVLESVTALKIRGKYNSAASTTGDLDNFLMTLQ